MPICFHNYTIFQLHISISLILSDMSSFSHLLDLQLQEQVCYVHCGFCTTVLVVIVPYRCLSMVVTVKCGHCTSLLSVNMMRSTFLPLHFSSYVDNHEEPMVEACGEDEEVPKLTLSQHNSSPLISSSSSVEDNDDDDDLDQAVYRVVNKPPEKRQRAPSAYNRFIKEELTRLKAQHPNMSHKQAFSAAAKNWALSPPLDQTKEDKSGLGDEPMSDGSGACGSDQSS